MIARNPVILLFALAPLSYGCTTANETVLPNGTRGEIIHCDGIQHSIADCYQRAGSDCPRGYDIIGANGEAVPFTTVGSGGAFAGTSTKRSLMVHCR